MQADILKEDQGQNTCLFSTEFSLRMMADIQEWFIAQQVRNFYSVSISGYHIAEAGANPISQLAFTLANGFTYVEAYLARGMAIDDFAPNLSFFFSNGMDPEYTVIGRVARRIWAIAMQEKYGANERSQKLKYHVQTSGRSLHAQEMDFNDIRTTLAGARRDLRQRQQPAHQRLRRGGDDPVGGVGAPGARDPDDHQPRSGASRSTRTRSRAPSSSTSSPTSSRPPCSPSSTGSPSAAACSGAMETGYQRGRIQDESMLYEHRKHDGSLPIVGVNTFRNPHAGRRPAGGRARARLGEREGEPARPGHGLPSEEHRVEAEEALARLKASATSGENVFAVLMDAARVCSLQQVTEAFFEVGGQYRRNV